VSLNDPDAELPGSFSTEHPAATDINDVDMAIDAHPGLRSARRLKDLERVFAAWAAFSIALSEILRKCETDEATIVELVIRNIGDTSKQVEITNVLDQATIAYVAGIGALIDQARIVVESQNKQLQAEYAKRVTAITESVPGALFLGKLRNYVLHYVVAPWEFSAEQQGNDLSAKVMLSSTELLTMKKWPAPVREFIASTGDQLHLSPLLPPYLSAMQELMVWLINRCWDDNTGVFDEVDNLTRKRNLLLSGGVTDGHDWAARIANMSENTARVKRGEPQIDFETGRPKRFRVLPGTP
jgi:hypothetical protein